MSGWRSPALRRVAEALRETTGLVFASERAREVEAVLTQVAERHGLSGPEALLPLLRAAGGVREEVVAQLTVGESYFQREPEQMQLLRTHVLPDLLLSTPPGGTVSVWSAGCARGEEPYTLAILLEEMGASERARILATDVASERLEQARRGVFSRWSLRASGEAFRDRWFRPRGRTWELDPRIRSRVEFRQLNLAEDVYPSASSGVSEIDLILCRNVLIYFDAETVRRVAERLIASLSPRGWLLLGSSDPPLADLVECRSEVTGAGVVYRRPDAEGGGHRAHPEAGPAEAPAPPPAWGPTPAEGKGAPEAHPLEHGGSRADAPPPPEGAPPDAVPEPAPLARPAAREPLDWAARLRALAGAGHFDEARALRERVAAEQGPSAELLYLGAVLELQAGQLEAAVRSARGALYLDRSLVVAHLALAEAERRRGSADEARRALRNAAGLLARLPPDEIVAGSDGETAGRLREVVALQLRLLGSAA